MNEQPRSPKTGARAYRLGRRAEHVGTTRRRITEAAVRLHTSVGPSETSFAAVAAEAGVTRLTLYRHFATPEELFGACMAHWRDQHPPPDVDAWRSVRAFEPRLRRGIEELYRWYAANAGDLWPLYRDAAFTPAATQAARRQNINRMTDAILGVASSRPLRAATAHVLGYWTWRSLAVDEACSDEMAVDLAVGFVLSARRAQPAARGRGVRGTRKRTERAGEYRRGQ